MMYRWDSDMIRFMRDASEYGTYFEELAKWMQPYFAPSDHVCDAGCGLGYLSLELAAMVNRVTAVDMNADALEVLRENCALRDIRNVEIRRGPVEQLTRGKRYDHMVFCSFGGIDQILKIAAQQCEKAVFIVKKNYQNHRFSVGTYSSDAENFEQMCIRLQDAGIPYEAVAMELEFGQPFRKWEDAFTFFNIYSRDPDKTGITETFIQSRLERTAREDFPWYMPHLRRVGCVKINVEDIPKEPAVESLAAEKRCGL